MNEKAPGKLQAGCPDLPYICDVCGKHRSHGNHGKCSKIRQAKNRPE